MKEIGGKGLDIRDAVVTYLSNDDIPAENRKEMLRFTSKESTREVVEKNLPVEILLAIAESSKMDVSIAYGLFCKYLYTFDHKKFEPVAVTLLKNKNLEDSKYDELKASMAISILNLKKDGTDVSNILAANKDFAERFIDTRQDAN
jgi:hypothetical protein